MALNKTYINNTMPKKAQLRKTKGGDTALIIDFHPDDDWESQYDPSIWMTLKPEFNDSNIKVLEALGVTVEGGELTPSYCENSLKIPFEGPTIVLVDGKPKYVNQGRCLKVFDNR